jgi:hypothetical protein
MKVCITCRLEKDESEFHKTGNICKLCKSIYNKQYNENNNARLREQRRIFYKDNKERLLEEKRLSYKENKEAILQRNNAYLLKNKKKVRIRRLKRQKERRKIDPIYRLRSIMSTAIYLALRKIDGSKNDISCFRYLKYSIQDLKEYIEPQFEFWMNWDNQGKYSPKTWDDSNPATWTWQLDHIIPQSKLPYSSMEEENFQKCWSLENLRPYSAKQNNLDKYKR